MEQAHTIPTEPRRRGRPRKAASLAAAPVQFPGKVIRFDSRPRLAIGDVVELCRGCQPGNRGKVATIEAFKDDGSVLVRSMFQPFDTVDPDTRAPTGQDMIAALPPENLYRLDNARLTDVMRRIK